MPNQPGGPPWSQRGTKNGGQTVAVNNRPEIVYKELTQTDPVPAGSTESVELYAPPGSVYEVLQMRIHVNSDADATTGSHKYVLDSAGEIFTILGSNNHDGELRFERGWWRSGGTNQPDDRAAMQQAMQSLRADENQPIKFRYQNETDAAMENDRQIQVVVLEESY